MSVHRYEVNEQKAFFHESGLDSFSKICSDALEKQAPCKERRLRTNHKPFINPKISKAIKALKLFSEKKK